MKHALAGRLAAAMPTNVPVTAPYRFLFISAIFGVFACSICRVREKVKVSCDGCHKTH